MNKLKQLLNWGQAPLSTLALLVLSAILITGVAGVIFTASYGVPVGDDYLAIKTFSNKHTWFGEAWASLIDTGRYMQSITASVTYGVLRESIAVILPIIVVLWLYLLIFLFTSMASRKVAQNASKSAILLVSAGIMALIVTAGYAHPDQGVFFLYQPFFFSSAIVTYTIPLLLYLSLVYIYIKNASKIKVYKKTHLLIFSVSTLLIGLFNETLPATIATISAGLLALHLIPSVKKTSPIPSVKYLALSILSSITALALMYLSPARADRSEQLGGVHSDGVIATTIDKVFSTLSTYFTVSDILIVIAFGLAIAQYIIISKVKPSTGKRLFIFSIITLFSGVCSLFVSVGLLTLGYGEAVQVYGRTLLIPQILLITGALCLFTSLGLFAHTYQKRGYITVATLLLVITLSTIGAKDYIQKNADNIHAVTSYRALWVEQDAYLKNASETSPNETIYTNSEAAGIGDGFSVSCNSPSSQYTSWLNRGMQAYYGVSKICSKDDLK